jgi:hypothetical protein
MGQTGCFDLSDRHASLDARKDPLVEIDAVVPWKEFRPALERVWRKSNAERKSRAGCQADGHGAHVQGAGAERAFQPFRVSLRTPSVRENRRTRSNIRSATGCRSCGFRGLDSGTGCQDGLAVSRCACAGGQGRGSVQAVRRIFGAARLHCARRADP